jgi:serine/threonine protein kinase
VIKCNKYHQQAVTETAILSLLSSLSNEHTLQMVWCEWTNIPHFATGLRDASLETILYGAGTLGRLGNRSLNWIENGILDVTMRCQYAVQWCKALISGVLYIHSLGILHRDIKPSNILITDDQLRLADFGLSTYCAQDMVGAVNVCSLMYRAPELMLWSLTGTEHHRYGVEIDYWSTAVVLFELLYRCHPYDAYWADGNKDMLDCVTRLLGTPSTAQHGSYAFSTHRGNNCYTRLSEYIIDDADCVNCIINSLQWEPGLRTLGA